MIIARKGLLISQNKHCEKTVKNPKKIENGKFKKDILFKKLEEYLNRTII